jgi:hypothetical protein
VRGRPVRTRGADFVGFGVVSAVGRRGGARAVDEVHFLCEVENDVELVRMVLSMLEETGEDFRRLIRSIRAQQRFESDRHRERCEGPAPLVAPPKLLPAAVKMS